VSDDSLAGGFGRVVCARPVVSEFGTAVCEVCAWTLRQEPARSGPAVRRAHYHRVCRRDAAFPRASVVQHSEDLGRSDGQPFREEIRTERIV
jgi:hypothetical protein